MNPLEYLKWLKTYVHSLDSKKISAEIKIIKSKLEKVTGFYAKEHIPFAGTTFNYPQEVWVSTNSYHNDDIEIKYCQENVDNREDKTDIQ
jgi:hypothetical protein